MNFFFGILLGFIFCNSIDYNYSRLDSVLNKYVDSDGLVDYQSIIDSPYNINEYLYGSGYMFFPKSMLHT